MSIDADDWRRDAETRIARYRMAQATVQLMTPDGAPYVGPVSATLVSPDFKLGCCLASTLRDKGPDGDRYRAWLRPRLDVAVSENAMKWYSLGRTPGTFDSAPADAELAWCQEVGVPMRGHCLLWSKEKFAEPWMKALDPAGLRRAITAHLTATLHHFGDRVLCFDSINEMLDGDFFTRRLGPDAHSELHLLMNRLAPKVPLFVNEYSIIDNDQKLARYLALIGQLRNHGVKLGGIGIQEHAAERFVPLSQRLIDDKPERQGMAPLIPHEVWDRLDRLSATGLPIHITEVSFRSDDDEAKAEALERFVLTAAAHPNVEQFLIWGFWESAHWLGRTAAFVTKDWTDLAPAKRWDALRARFCQAQLTTHTTPTGQLTLTGPRGQWRLSAQGQHTQVRLDGTTTTAVLV